MIFLPNSYGADTNRGRCKRFRFLLSNIKMRAYTESDQELLICAVEYIYFPIFLHLNEKRFIFNYY